MRLPAGFQFAGVACGIKPSGKPDLALIAADSPATMAGVYTQNVVCAASIDWNRRITPTDRARAIVINSGNANACTGNRGVEDNRTLAEQLARQLQADPADIGVLSTGVIGRHLPMNKIESGLQELVASAGSEESDFRRAANAILTTDHSLKIGTGQCQVGDAQVRIAGMAKGAGMIGPNMATMLSVICTDACLTPEQAQRLIRVAAGQSFNRISVEGHTSTNDALLLIASGRSGASFSEESDLAPMQSELNRVCIEMAQMIPADGEGASHLVEIRIGGAADDMDADRVARSIALSALVKTAISGGDPNWGRIVSAAGYSGAAMDLSSTRLKVNGHLLFEQGEPVAFDAVRVSGSIKQTPTTLIELEVGRGSGTAVHWTSDLTVDYVRFNSEYTT